MTATRQTDSTTPRADELDRLAALYGSGLLDDGPQSTLDALVATAAALLDCPTAMLTVVDHDTLRVRATTGAPLAPVPRQVALCDHAIREPDGLVVPDLAEDPRFAASPELAGLRFYAGMPIHAPGTAGAPRAIGALCITDAAPRDLDERGRRALRNLARIADHLIAARTDVQRAIGIAGDHRRLVADVARQHRLFGQAERMTGIGSWRMTLADERLEWSPGVHRIYGVPSRAMPDLSLALEAYPPEARGRVAATLARAIERGEAFDFEEDFRRLDGELRRVRCIGENEQVDGVAVALVGVFQDVTDRHHREIALRRDADTDALTGLGNRAAFDKALAATIARSHATGSPLLLALIDLDGFKAVNDTLGHAAGDEVLRTVGTTLRGLRVAAATIARIGGDEFALLVEDDDDAAALADAVDHALVLSASDFGLTLACSGSVGAARLEAGEDARDFVHRADMALYAAKRARIGERRRAERRAA